MQKLKNLALITILAISIVSTPPPSEAQIQVRSDIVVLSETTSLSWNFNPEEDVIGYMVQIQTGTNIWSKDVGNTNRANLFAVANVQLPNGLYTGRVAAYNSAGLMSEYASISTNLYRRPGKSNGVKFNP
jgi:hypothetical protein